MQKMVQMYTFWLMAHSASVIRLHHCHCWQYLDQHWCHLSTELLITWFIPVSFYVTYILAYLAHKCTSSNLGMCMYVTFEGHNCWCHIFYSSMVSKCFGLLIVFNGCRQYCGVLYVYFNRSAKRHICAIWQGIFFQGHMPVMWHVCISVLPVTISLQWFHIMYIYWQRSHTHAYLE